MVKSDIHEPKQKRSIEKKKHIMETGIELMIKKGYHRTLLMILLQKPAFQPELYTGISMINMIF